VSKRIALFEMVGDTIWSSFNEGEFSGKGGVASALHSAESITRFLIANRYKGINPKTTHIAAAVFPVDLSRETYRILGKFSLGRSGQFCECGQELFNHVHASEHVVPMKRLLVVRINGRWVHFWISLFAHDQFCCELSGDSQEERWANYVERSGRRWQP